MWQTVRKYLLRLKNQPDLRNSLLLIITFWVARYWYISRFGLYEDDLTIIPRAMQMNFGELFNYVSNFIVHFYGHARPLHDSFIYIFSNFGYSLAGFNGPYLIGFMIVALNSILFYFLMRRTAGQTAAFLCGLAYVLFSADTTQSFLTHSLGLHPSLTLLLLASHAYFSKRNLLAYLLAFTILFSYETPFLVFAGIPLLQKEWDRFLFKKWLRHCMVLVAMLIGVYLLRLAIGADRVTEMTPLEMLWISLTHSLIGPLVNLGTYFYRPLQTLRSFSLEIGVVVLAAWLIFTYFLKTQPAVTPLALNQLKLRARFWTKWSDEFKAQLRLLIAGFVMLVCAYPLTFTVSAHAITGRETRLHAAGVVGAAIVVGILAILLLQFVRSTRWQNWATWGITSMFALLVGYGFVLQNDYAKGWSAQQRFWRELLPLIDDVGPDTVVLVEPGVFSYESIQIGANYWNLPRTLNQIYTFPTDWKNPPRVYRLIPGWQNNILTSEGYLRLDVTTTVAPPSLYKEVDPANVILIQNGDKPYRRNQNLVLDGQVIILKEQDLPILPALPHGFLYPYLLGESP
jgi:hypothetical protein